LIMSLSTVSTIKNKKPVELRMMTAQEYGPNYLRTACWVGDMAPSH